MRLHMPSFPTAASALARALRVLALPLAFAVSAAADTPAADPEHEVLAFQPCPDAPGLECAALSVPIDYQAPGRTVAVAVARAKNLDPARRIGVLFVHPGGHVSGIDFLRGIAPSPLAQRIRQRFDLVSLDPRGAGRTRPLHCGFDLPAAPPTDDDAALIAFLDEYGRRVAAQCLDEDPDFVRSISGNNFARDIDRLRAALGERQLTLALFSNSGPVAGAYATLFPRRVRALLLDAPVGPEHRDYWIERRIEQGGSYERALQRVDQICRRSPGCPLETTGVVNAFDEIVRRLTKQPVPLPNGGLFTAEDFRFTFFELLPVEEFWAPTVQALAGALEGDLSPFIGIATSGGGGDDGIVARLCNDYGTRRPAADYLPITEAAGAIHPRFLDRMFLSLDAALCASWPAADPPRILNSAARLDVPPLSFHAEFDSDAPFAWSQRLTHAMGDDRHIVRYQGGGHGIANRAEPCIRQAVEDYLYDLRLPAEGLTCPASFVPGLEWSEPARLPSTTRLPSEAPLRLR